ncbi:hypothetical protein, unlikely [Trypanosoma brucei gambiense DAL972]|uniref:Uncharacterized protein n=1 Tax=Trypanosoma brucei gambiense (strain MHOM/CI/86/DAL972) TaxID=679716 RepID=D0A3Y2_TRYB9|nr:hypothetical protein, unlikely [Trypanosoma brucei gambiense DAL972]CBH15976.1 hypothetical protein, unlikely [Trypanosoma brucei gambiense DAL972]|eukprot:XP_011778240.1 hypothetical protein, unlikely [Trypanosoma brucei gambiense DAL972]
MSLRERILFSRTLHWRQYRRGYTLTLLTQKVSVRQTNKRGWRGHNRTITKAKYETSSHVEWQHRFHAVVTYIYWRVIGRSCISITALIQTPLTYWTKPPIPLHHSLLEYGGKNVPTKQSHAAPLHTNNMLRYRCDKTIGLSQCCLEVVPSSTRSNHAHLTDHAANEFT